LFSYTKLPVNSSWFVILFIENTGNQESFKDVLPSSHANYKIKNISTINKTVQSIKLSL
jgi:hypothetical protein